MNSLPAPSVYVVDERVIDLHQVATVICAIETGTAVCRVILKSGTSFTIDMQYRRSLTQAVAWSQSPGSNDDPTDVVDKINKALKKQGLVLAADDLLHDGYGIFTLQPIANTTEGL